jgi:hypothetical protein
MFGADFFLHIVAFGTPHRVHILKLDACGKALDIKVILHGDK